MNLLKEVFANEVYPALGCTEPISCAYAAATAAAQLGEPIESLTLRVDRGVFKNGASVTVPYSQNLKGNLIAATLGAVLARPQAKLLPLQDVTSEVLERARHLIAAGKSSTECAIEQKGLYVKVTAAGSNHTARCVLAGGHVNIERIERDGKIVFLAEASAEDTGKLAYRRELRQMDIAELLELADTLDDDDRVYLRRGVEMNLAMPESGYEVGGTAHQLRLI
jgi:L-cysteine desulfidase